MSHPDNIIIMGNGEMKLIELKFKIMAKIS
jgi:hypothetical protein